MTHHNLRCFRISAVAMILLSAVWTNVARAEEKPDAALSLWYRRPAERWLDALPLGNGRLGAMVFGGIEKEQIALNESTYWSGEPSDKHDPPEGKKHLAEIRKLFFDGKYHEGVGLVKRYLLGQRDQYGTHLPLGNLQLKMKHASGEARDYRRELNLDRAIATVEYSLGGVRFRREALASHVDGAFALRLTADKPGQISFRASFHGGKNRPWKMTPAGTDTLTLTGDARELRHSNSRAGVSFHGLVRARAEGGTVRADAEGLHVDAADAVTLLIVVNTTFKGRDPAKLCEEQMAAVEKKTYDEIRAAHLADHQQLFRRVAIDLGTSPAAALPTDQRRERLGKGESDPQLAALFFQYGRYLLIAGSREDSPLPTNLQGIWNDDLACNMGWTCDFHLDINTQQNYWPSEVCNLSECGGPLFRLVESLREPGRRTAGKVYGCRGWVCHVFTNAWGYTAPGWGTGWGTHPTGGAWIASHLWQHYVFTGDKTFLAKHAYPTLKESAEFFLDYMVEHPKHGWLVTGPSTSPENTFIAPGGGAVSESMGPTHDRVVVHELLTSCIESSRILGIDGDFRARCEKALAKLPPFQIGKHGQLQEWLEDFDEAEPNHRHTSHLLALYPGNQITPRGTPELAHAARVTIERRLAQPNWEDGEWSRANMIGFFARLGDGDRAAASIHDLIAKFSGGNLLTFWPGLPGQPDIFCIDGNYAGTACIAEMLLQSHAGEIELLPALPKAWPAGGVRGLCARGGFEIDLQWRDARLVRAEIHSRLGGPCQIRYRTPLTVTVGGAAVKVDRVEKDAIVFPTKAGARYVLVLNREEETAISPAAEATANSLSLVGEWKFRLDPRNVGDQEKWHDQQLADPIKLPGSMAENGYGDEISAKTSWVGAIRDKSWFHDKAYEPYRQPGSIKIPFWLQPRKHYVGAAWYQREIEIPRDWKNKRATLFLERAHWETTVWVDGKRIGSQDSLCTPHEYDFGCLEPGRHRLTIRIDNRIKINVGADAHSVSDNTQTNWNGLVGRLELRATDPVWIEDVQVYPNMKTKTAKLRITIKNATGQPLDGQLALAAASFNSGEKHEPQRKLVPFTAEKSEAVLNVEYSLGEGTLAWDEFSPTLYRLDLSLDTRHSAPGALRDKRSVVFGMREFGVKGRQFAVNGRPTFLRGTQECCGFPLTGYPNADVDVWTRNIKVAQSFGLNYFRFHSWCPPEAAFQAADRLGFMFQVELPVWNPGSVGDDPQLNEYMIAEGDRILRAYGNHPSFCMFCTGNEPGGKEMNTFLGKLVESWKNKDPRRLYTAGAGYPQIPENQYHDFQVFGKPFRGQNWGEGLKGRFNANPPNTDFDYRKTLDGYQVPCLSHETGQWCAYPNFKEISKYTGVLRANNYKIFRDFLAKNHQPDQAKAFLMASGRLQVQLYKEEIESNLRTPNYAGFNLLGLQDFSGQGTAPVGVLDDFWDAKPYVTAEEYRQFCCETVPLLRMANRTWTADETFQAAAEIAHYGPAPMERATPVWTVADAGGKLVARGEFPALAIPLGSATPLGTINLPLSSAPAPAKLVVKVALKGTPYANQWDFWVYPARVDTAAPKDILVTDSLSDDALAALKQGGKVLLMPGPGKVKGDGHGAIPAGFTTIFWNTAWTQRQAPHTMGILCDPKHPALASFPTDYHGNWQWWELVTQAQTMILNNFPSEFHPVVQVIDDWFTARRLALVFEARVGGGKLLVCGIDLRKDLDSRPVARQMLHSLLSYMESREFKPAATLDPKLIQELLVSEKR